MAKHLVTFLIGVVVEAEDKEAALQRAHLPFRLGAIPHLCGIVSTGSRLATEDDENGGIQHKIEALASEGKVI